MSGHVTSEFFSKAGVSGELGQSKRAGSGSAKADIQNPSPNGKWRKRANMGKPSAGRNSQGKGNWPQEMDKPAVLEFDTGSRHKPYGRDKQVGAVLGALVGWQKVSWGTRYKRSLW